MRREQKANKYTFHVEQLIENSTKVLPVLPQKYQY